MKRLLLLLSVFWRGCASLTSGPPLLDAGDELLVKAGEPLILNCTGSKPLYWKTHDEEMNYTVTGSPTESTLAVEKIESLDTGYFYCHYENVSDFESDKENVDSTYVYVHDETGTGFVKSSLQDEIVAVFGTLVIDCTVTHPNLNITLTHNTAEITNQERVSFDPRKGFSVENETWNDAGTYTCKDGRGHEINKKIYARQISKQLIRGRKIQYYVRGYSFELKCWNFDNVDAQFTWTYPNSKAEHRVEQDCDDTSRWSFLRVQNASDSDTGVYTCSASAPGYLPNSDSVSITIVRVRQINKPWIRGGENQNYVRGYSFELKCWTFDNVDAQFTWTYPNSKAEHRVEHDSDATHCWSFLRVQNASYSDTGVYTCSVSAPGYLSNNVSEHITIVRARKIRKPRIRGVEKQHFVREYSFELKCVNLDYVDAQLTWSYPNSKSEHRVEQDSDSTEQWSFLRVQNASYSDTGDYTCSASAPGYLPNSVSEHITISRGRPHKLKLNGVPSSLKEGMSLNITCSAVGFPPADVSLQFQDCSSGCNSCSPPVKVLQTGKENTAVLTPGNIVEKNMTFSPHTSGLLWCVGENSFGTRNTSAVVRISDIGGMFVLRHRGENGTVEIGEREKRVSVLENDHFSLVCGGSKFDHRTVSLTHTSPDSSNTTVFQAEESKFSWIVNRTVAKATLVLAGSYNCTAELREGQQINIKRLTLTVHGEQKVHFTKESNLKNQTVEVTMGASFYLSCSVAGMPEPTVQWLKDGKVLSPTSEFFDEKTMKFSSNSRELILSTVLKRHAGVYTCVARNRMSEVTGSFTISLPARQINKLRIRGRKKKYYVRGYSFELKCWNFDNVDAQFTWTYPNSKAEHGVEQDSNDRHHWSFLRVQNASYSDKGVYTCSVSAPGYLPNNVSEHITIVRVRQIIKPHIRGYQNQDYVRGHSFKLKCVNYDYVDAQLTWTYPNSNAEHGLEQDSNDSHSWSFLKVQNASESDTGVYICSVSAPGYLPNSDSVNITIRGRPHKLKMNGVPSSLKEGMSLNITCSAVGFPPADVSLQFQYCSSGNNSCSPPVKVLQTGKENTAVLTPGNIVEKNMTFSPHTSGLLWCVGENILGTGNTSAAVRISSRGVSKGVQVELTISLVGIALLFLVVFVLLTQVKRERKKSESFKAMRDRLIKGNIGQLNPNCTVEQQAVNLPYDESRWEVPRRNITPGKLLGSGTFGQVIKATVIGLRGRATTSSTTVAIKMCKSPTFKQLEAFIMELKIMIHLGQHLNVVNLMGASTVQCDQDLWILVEYCRFGDILNFMKRHRREFIDQIDAATGRIDFERTAMDPSSPLPHSSRTSHVQALVDTQASLAPSSPQSALSSPPPGHCAKAVHLSTVSSDNSSTNLTRQTSSPLSPSDSCFMGEAHSDSKGKAFTYEVGSVPGVSAPFSTCDLLSWGWQAAQGMAYLSNRNILHGDLAARNLLLADNNVVKISDFGMSRDVYKDNVYKKKKDALMPIKWMSVEGIRDRIFSVQSDVWAFGITLWEIFSLGGSPYPDINCTGLLRHLEDGHRMSRPKYANDDIHIVMMECWKAKPMERPSFYQLVDILGYMMPSRFREEYLITNGVYCFMLMNKERFKAEPDYINMMANPTFENMTKAAEPDGTLDKDDQEHINNSASVEIEIPCRVSYTPGERCPSTLSPGNNYLPMKDCVNPVRPSSNVFSPRSQEEPSERFTFPSNTIKSVRLSSLPEEEETNLLESKQSPANTPFQGMTAQPPSEEDIASHTKDDMPVAENINIGDDCIIIPSTG